MSIVISYELVYSEKGVQHFESLSRPRKRTYKDLLSECSKVSPVLEYDVGDGLEGISLGPGLPKLLVRQLVKYTCGTCYCSETYGLGVSEILVRTVLKIRLQFSQLKVPLLLSISSKISLDTN